MVGTGNREPADERARQRQLGIFSFEFFGQGPRVYGELREGVETSNDGRGIIGYHDIGPGDVAPDVLLGRALQIVVQGLFPARKGRSVVFFAERHDMKTRHVSGDELPPTLKYASESLTRLGRVL